MARVIASKSAPTTPIPQIPLAFCEADEEMPTRTRKSGSVIQATAIAAYVAACATFTESGVTKTYRAEGDKAASLVSAIRKLAADDRRSVITAPSKVAGSVLWQVTNTAPATRTRKPKAEAAPWFEGCADAPAADTEAAPAV